MKKIFLLLIFIVVFTLEVDASIISSDFKTIFIWYYHYVDANGNFGDFEIFKRISDEKIAYCIEPGVPLSSEIYLGYEGLSMEELASKVGISKDLLEEISLYSYYGYGYKNHKETAWIVATQVKIWELLGRNVQFTSQNSEEDPFRYVIDTPSEVLSMMNELDSLVSIHKQKSSISNQHFKIPFGDSYETYDSLLEDYQVNSPYVSLSHGHLKIEPTSVVDKTNVTLFRENNYWTQDFIVYHHDVGQDLILIGNVFDDEVTFSFESISGSVEIEKLDFDSQSCSSSGKATLDGAVYGIYRQDDDSLISTLTIHNCFSSYHGLPIGDYYLKEITAPYGYELDLNAYSFHITDVNIQEPQKILLYDKLKTVNLSINKKFVQDYDVTLPEEGATFDIISKSSNKVVAMLITDKDGNASINLPYDDYTIVQKKGKENYHFVPNKDFIITDHSQDISFRFLNKPYTKKVKVIKYEKDTNQKILLAGISFKIFDTIRGHYVCETEDCIYKTNELGEFTTQELFYSTYTLEEVQMNIPNILWNSQKVTFSLDQDSEEILEIPFYNEIPTGRLEIHKVNELQKPLENVSFHLYAKEDIYDIHHKLIYSKDELVSTLITDFHGHILVENLPIGAYYLQEISSLDSYLLDPTIYDIDLNYKDELTPVVEFSLDLINYSIPKTKKNSFPFLLYIIFLGGVWLYEKKYFYSIFSS